MEIQKIWEGVECGECDDLLKYDDLCSNVNYLKKELVSALKTKNNFYFVCNFTINNHFGPTLNERDFIADLVEELGKTFKIKQFEILNDRGTIIAGTKK